MKIIFKIAKNEFRYLFYSPIAWFLLVVFLVQCAVFYTGPVLSAANQQEIMIKNDPAFKGFSGSLTTGIFLNSEIFTSVIRNLYLFIPLLTMGLISRDINNGTARLLYSSPVGLRRIVIGKYLGIMLYSLLLVLIVAIFMVTGLFNIQNADYGLLLSATLGFYLLVGAYAAIGLFMSSLTTYQVVSAIGSFAVIFILSRIGGLWQKYDFVRDLTYFLSLQNRTGKMLAGLITSKDVIYFAVVTSMFVGFTFIKIKNGMESRPGYVKTARYLLLIVLALLTGYISSRPALTGYLDATATQSNTIHPRTQKILGELGDSTLEVTLYANLFGGGLAHGLPEARNADYLSNLWEPYLRFKPDIRFKYVYYYDYDPGTDDSLLYKQFPGKTLEEIAAENAEAMDADLSMYETPERIRRVIDLRPERNRLVMQLKYRGRTAFLRTFEDPFFWPDETNVNAALKRLLNASMPKIAFVNGELERSIYKTGEREYAFHTASRAGRGTLANTGFDVDTINLSAQDITPDITAVVLADPKMELSPQVSGKLRDYVNRGGNMLIAGEPGKQQVLNPFLAQWGIQLMNGQLVQPSADETPDKIVAYVKAAGASLSPALSWINSKDVTDTATVLMQGATALAHAGSSAFAVKPLLMTLPGKAWLKKGALVIDSVLPPFNPQEGDVKASSFPAAIQLSRQIKGNEQRMIICGDADFASNMRLGPNAYFLMPFYSWLAYNQFPIYTPRPSPEDLLLRIGERAARIQQIVYVWILPCLLLAAGTILLIRRKRK